MSKLLLFLSFLLLIFVGIGTLIAPNNMMFWLATGGDTYQYVRIVLGSLTFLQLVTKPPRHILFRVLSGSIALVAGMWTLELTVANHMLILDTLAFLGASVAILVTSLERKELLSNVYSLTDGKSVSA